MIGSGVLIQMRFTLSTILRETGSRAPVQPDAPVMTSDKQGELTSTWDLMLQTRINLSRSAVRMMMDSSNQQSNAKVELLDTPVNMGCKKRGKSVHCKPKTN